MDLAELHQLVAAGESECLEFKKATGRTSRRHEDTVWRAER